MWLGDFFYVLLSPNWLIDGTEKIASRQSKMKAAIKENSEAWKKNTRDGDFENWEKKILGDAF